MKLNNKMKNKKLIFIITLFLLLIEVNSLYFMYKAYISKKINFNEINFSDNSKSIFAILIEQTDGTYIESNNKIWPRIGYNYNREKSGCVDENGNILNGILDFRHGVNIATVETKNTSYCYLYFDKLTDDITVNIDSIDGKIHNVGNYNRSIYCDNSDTILNEQYNRLEFSNIKYPTNCTLFFDEPVANNKTLISIVEDIKVKSDLNAGICSNEIYTSKTECENKGFYWWGVFDENGLRFEGERPDNYVWFNNELWRIIGNLPVKSTISNDINLIKIVRDDAIGAYSQKSTTFLSSNFYFLLNDYYYKKEDGTKSGYCYSYSTTVTTTCDYREIGLNDQAREMVEPVQWAIGERNSISTASNHYISETTNTKWTSVNGGIYVGLMSASDYGYGVLADDCVRTIALNKYNTATCAGKNWLRKEAYEQLLAKYDGSNSYRINNVGNIAASATANIGLVRPALYLDKDVYVIKGNGTITNPYIIGM